MNWYTNVLMGMAMKLLAKSLPFVTEKMRALLMEGLDRAEEYANTTAYDLDNQVVEILRGILAMPAGEPCETVPEGTATVEVTGQVVRP